MGDLTVRSGADLQIASPRITFQVKSHLRDK